MGYAFGVVEAVDRKYDLSVFKVFEYFFSFMNGGRILRGLMKDIVIDAKRKDVHFDDPVGQGDSPVLVIVSFHHAYRLQEMLNVFMRMKSDHVGPQHAVDDGILPGIVHHPEDFIGGKGNMKKKSDRGVGEFLPYQRGHQEQLVVVNPEHIAWFCD